MRHSTRAAVSVAACLLLAAWLGACADGTGPSRDPTDHLAAATAAVPLPLRVHQRFEPAPGAILAPCEPAELGVALPSHLTAVGNASHLGRVRSLITGGTCTLNPSGVLTVSGVVTHTAANGDALEGSWSGTMGAGLIALDVVFTGGTGRFAGATGSGTLQGTFDPATGSGEWDLEGWLTRAR